MSLTFPKRAVAGAAVAGTLKTPGLTATDGRGTAFQSSTSLTGWTDISGANWSYPNAYVVVTFGYGTTTIEKILCTFDPSNNTFYVYDRAYDGTTAVAHTTGELFINTFSATEAAELNAATQALKPILQNSGTVTTPQPISVGSGAGSIGTGTQPAAIDHDHKISVSALNSWLSGSASGAMNSAVSVYLSSLAAGALPTAITASGTWVGSSSTSTGPTASGITGYNRYIVIAWSKVTGTGSGAIGNLNLSITANGAGNLNPVSQSITAPYNATAITLAVLSPGASTTFSAQCVPQTAASVSAWANYLIVIGLN